MLHSLRFSAFQFIVSQMFFLFSPWKRKIPKLCYLKKPPWVKKALLEQVRTVQGWVGERQREFELDFPRFAAWSRTWQCHPFLFSIFLFSGVRESSTGSSRDNASIGGCWIFQWLEAEQSPERGAEAARAHRGILPAPSFPQGAVQECQQLLWGFFLLAQVCS